jgi:hypothetical protein
MKITREELRAIIKEEVKGSKELAQISSTGTMERGQIISSLEKKLLDMIERNREGRHNTLGISQFNTLFAEWSAVSEPRE